MLKNLTIKLKIILLMVSSMLFLTIFLVGFSVYEITTSLQEENYLKLTATRDSKANQITNFFAERIGDIKVLSQSEELHVLLKDLIDIEHDLHLSANEKYPITNNLVTEVIGQHDAFFQSYAKEYGYYDIFLISPLGHVVYTQARESDWGENLKSGTLKESGLAQAWQQALEKKRPVFIDMKPYAPSQGAPAMFLSTPVIYKGELEGVLVFQISDKAINKIMKFRQGYGDSQEDYLVGSDYLMRSDSFLDPDGHSLRASFKNKATVETQATKEALEGKENTAIIMDYNNNPVLSAYKKVSVGKDLSWAILSEIDEAEIMEKPIELRNVTIMISLVILALILAFSIYIINTSVIQKIARFQQGVLGFFNYLNKESNEVSLLSTTSNDEIDTMAKVVNENIQKTKKLIEEDNQLINNVKDVVENVKRGNLTSRITVSTINESLEELKIIFNEMLEIMAENVCGDMNKIQNALKQFQELNFSHRVPNPTGKTSQGLNALANIINEMLVENKSNGLTLENSSNLLMKNVEILSTASNQAAASLEETAAALEEITSTIVNNADNVNEMSSSAKILTNSAKQGQSLAHNTTTAMDDITEQVTLINEAISVIDQIAFQTNILSLNAAVEAATAGEAGKGFAVVAQEVRNLASRSAEAAKEIKDLVENATNKAAQGKTISGKMITGYEELLENINGVTYRIEEITQASKEQEAGITQINDAISELDQQTQQNAQVASDTKQIANNTLNIANTVVKNANAKEFIGKEEVKAKEIVG